MMSVLARQHSISDTGVESPRCDSRLVFPPSATAQGVVDGSWWPRTRDPAAELPALIAAVTDRVGMVDRIMLNADAWDTRPRQITTVGQHVVRLDWSGAWDAHMIRVTSCDSSHLDLLVIPPDTVTVLALTCLAIAAAPSRSPNRRADPFPTGTPVTLRSVPPPVGRPRAQREQAGRWETDGGRVRELTDRATTSSTVPQPRMCPPRRQPPPHHHDTAGHRNPRFRVVRGP
jgi:Family of unknown function (DUF5994)